MNNGIHVFEDGNLDKAIKYAESGGQALYLPYQYYGFLYDQNKKQLIATCKRYKIKSPKIRREGTVEQHVKISNVVSRNMHLECDSSQYAPAPEDDMYSKEWKP
jgi:hypothetical protein